MTYQELMTALDTKVPVEWRGRADHERARGCVTAIIYRGKDKNGDALISAEVATHSSPQSVIICRPEDVSFWRPIEERGIN